MDSKVIAPLSNERRTELVARLLVEPSDTKLALEFGISRKALWRMRQTLKKGDAPVLVAAPLLVMTPPAPEAVEMLPPVVIPPAPVPKVVVPKVLKSPQPPEDPAPPPAPPPPAPPPPTVDPRPKVDVEPVYLNTYFALQILRGESYKQVAQVVLTEAKAKGVLFRKLQVMDIVSVSTTAFVRFRSDMPDALAVLKSLQNRALIAVGYGGIYMVTFTNGRSGRFPMSTMCSSPKIGFGHTYAGTKIKKWQDQFAA